MQILISEAKLMRASVEACPLESSPLLFGEEANRLARAMREHTVEQLEGLFAISPQLAMENYIRFQRFHEASTPSMPALWAYSGQVYRYLGAFSLSSEALAFAEGHMWILSALYGLLRPSNPVRPYRMEVSLPLSAGEGASVIEFWKPRLTDWLIESVLSDDGVLVHLFAEEFKRLFDWGRVARSVRVIQPRFKSMRDGKARTVVVHTKSCRGAMVRHLLESCALLPEDILRFHALGYAYSEHLSQPDAPCFVREE